MSKNSAYSCLAWLATITLISVTVYLGCLPSTSQNKWQFMAQHLCQPFCSSSLMLTFPHLQIYLCSERTSPEQRQIHEPHLDGMGYDKLKLLDAHPCDGCNHWLAQLSDRLFLLVTSVTPRLSLANKIARARLLFSVPNSGMTRFWFLEFNELASPCPFCHNRASLWPLPIEFRARFGFLQDLQDEGPFSDHTVLRRGANRLADRPTSLHFGVCIGDDSYDEFDDDFKHQSE